MKEVMLFHLDDCPYCHNARRAIAELRAAKPDYAAIDVNWVEETRNPGLTEGRDYYYVPTIFYGDRKLYEAHPGEGYDEIKENVKRAFDIVLES